ncbi:DUF7314 family protein [Halococcus thailandensis]|uniref:DUF7314 domain-containing protein n=1 Tax=Halococcus thailandensis JCM 13552 TaxID=1227457 RepID=M0N0G0_9EURY|nr:hypothetical protein [Halococcus thailandensis]EMA50160.1 hypothetical protein C451_16715 [Halococcus thailandensis JCM 13552]
MSDEFIKGLATLCGGLFGWMVFSGWYTTEGFESTQLIAEVPTDPAIYGNIALTLREALFWFAIFGAITFWVLIPAGRQARAALRDRRSSN